MKIMCDVCNKEEALVFCCADEAALCDGCDQRVHHANKLAGKHHRFSLLHPTSKQAAPLCDICKERRAFLFCKEDRAILCRECDLPIHTANDLTRKHNRFLLTGVKISSLASPPSHTSSSTSPPLQISQQATKVTSSEMASTIEENQEISPTSISEYIETLPGWHVEDLLDSFAMDGFCKTDFLFPFLEADLETNFGLVSEEFPIWVPQVPQIHPPPQYGIGFKDFKEASNPKANKRWNNEVLSVPQISPPSKRSRTLW
ncbi:B-box zinc finger protein 21-like [Tasmannia lanceolata]|uniref:B-box zinc finger protein 21-like n=1 Tax=Tasmannia lanceolata TaxID=3420 RepID=UPI004062AE80